MDLRVWSTCAPYRSSDMASRVAGERARVAAWASLVLSCRCADDASLATNGKLAMDASETK